MVLIFIIGIIKNGKYDRNSVINKDINCTVEFKALIILAEVLKLGDYVEMTPTSTSYTIPTTLTAYSSSQTIKPSELSLWRVINIKEDETIEMVSEYVSSTDVNFYGAAGYKKLVEGLNTIAAQYANSKYTVATRHMGYDGQPPIIPTSLSKSTCGTHNTKDNSKETSGCGDISYETDANLVQSALGTLVVNRVTGGTPKNGYWLAARHYNYSNSALYQWNGWRVMSDGSVNSYKLYTYSDWLA